MMQQVLPVIRLVLQNWVVDPAVVEVRSWQERKGFLKSYIHHIRPVANSGQTG